MKAIIPVAGIGKRLQPLTNKVPKVLINIAGKPMLFHLIDELINSGHIDRIVLIIGYQGDQVQKAITTTYGGDKRIAFDFVEQKEMLGLGHAIYQARNIVGDEPVLIVLGDTIFEFDLEKMLKSEYSAIGVKNVEDVSRFGIVETGNGFIQKMIEKPAAGETESRSAIAGIYYIRSSGRLFNSIKQLMDIDIKTKGEYQLTDALQKMLRDGERLVPFEIQNWFDCGKPETLLSTNAYILNRDFSHVRHAKLTDVKIIPPVHFGSHCNVVGSTIGPNVTLADRVTVKDSKIDNSIICEDSSVDTAELSEVVLGRGEKISGVHLKKMKADKEEVTF